MNMLTILPGDTGLLRRLAPAAATHWNADPGTTEHIADSGNSVYRFFRNGEQSILRLTSPSYRTREHLEAEIEFLLHLDGAGVRIGAPVESRNGKFVEEVTSDDITMLASAFTFAPGMYVDRNSPHWNEIFFREWGATLGGIHRAARSFSPRSPHRRWDWRQEGFLLHAPELIPAEDIESHRELERVLRRLDDIPVNDDTFGLIHADFAPQNFHYDPAIGITTFDFGNCCYHWYASDIAISLSILRRFPEHEREIYRTWIIEGYREHYPLDDELLAEISWFIRLRILYVYLSRLVKFGPAPTAEEQKILQTMRASVHERFEW